MALLPGLPQKSVPAEEAHFINTKQLKFLLARSRWQVSVLPCGGLRGPGAEVSEAREGNEAQRAGSVSLLGLQSKGVGPGTLHFKSLLPEPLG